MGQWGGSKLTLLLEGCDAASGYEMVPSLARQFLWCLRKDEGSPMSQKKVMGDCGTGLASYLAQGVPAGSLWGN